MKTTTLSAALLVSLAAPAAQHGAHGAHRPELAGFEDYHQPAGMLEEGVLRVHLEVRAALWQPWGEDGPTLATRVFAVPGDGARVPGPLIRARVGTPLHVTLRNTLGDTILVRGLRDRGREVPAGADVPGPVAAAFTGDSLVLAPGETADVRFTPTTRGSFFYFAKTMQPGWSATPQPLFSTAGEDRGLVGVLIVDGEDEAANPDERILLITQWAERGAPETFLPSVRFMINGRSWPYTERLVYAQGDTVRWRVINGSGTSHPMHLHGFYFHVHEWTNQNGGAAGAPDRRPFVVTWALPSTTAMRISWVAHEPGNWVFHCHLMRHMSWLQAPPAHTGAREHGAHEHRAREHGAPERGAQAGARHGDVGDRAPGAAPAGLDLMGGLVMGITVRPSLAYAPSAEVARRRLRLHIGMRPGVFGDEPGYGFVLQEDERPPAPDSVRFPGSTLVLTRGEPTQITVFNHADVPLGVHWHGLELESRSDGVPGWSGLPDSPVPAIRPGDSLIVRMTPPRAGTFMYHVHSEPGHQLALGLYGTFLVLDPDRPRDPDTDRLFLMGSLGAGEDAPPAVNGRTEPEPLAFRAGTTYRLRFMHISPDDNKTIRFLDGDTPVTWRLVAVDGAELAPDQAREQPADVRFFDVGVTRDFLWTPTHPGELTLRIITTFDTGLPAFPRPAPEPHTMDIPVRVLPVVGGR
jgi:manganese oxidase